MHQKPGHTASRVLAVRSIKRGHRMIRVVFVIFTEFLLLCTVLLLYARCIEPSLLITRREVYTNKKAAREFTVVFITDTHFSTVFPRPDAERIANKINAAKPDMVLFGGDFIDDYTRDADTLDFDAICEALAGIEAPYGKYAVWGNHDYGHGAQAYYPAWMEKAGFTLLANETVDIPELNTCVVGVDYHTKEPYIPDTPEERFTILLMHHPIYADIDDTSGAGRMLGSDYGRIDLAFAGHTHGRQITFNKYKYTEGFYDVRDMTLFVGAGIGISNLPFRLTNPPEVAVISLSTD